ncbi:hypothetical protein DFH29DRAFT_981292 [Suillus ampliporus]|nr:hypothetical protein DFH29DRAFT_981292 [Suillus ampliporus]
MSLSRESEDHIQLTLNSAWADSTLHMYHGVILNFLQFSHCPASKHLLCHLAGDMVQNHMSALKAWHAFHNAPWLGATCLKLVLNNSSAKPLRPPITRSMLLVLAANLDLTDSFNSVVLWGQLHLGEILSDPICALELHLAHNVVNDDLPLFCYVLSSGLRCLTRQKLLARCNSIWIPAGFPLSSGHSFHMSGTTEFLLSGVPPDVVKALSHWSSDAFLCYWHSLKLLAPLHIRNLIHDSQPESAKIRFVHCPHLTLGRPL